MSTEQIVIPPQQGRAFRVARGQRFRVVTPKGGQCGDFFAYNAENVGEWLSVNHTIVWNRAVRPREGEPLLSRFRRPMLKVVKDGAGGVHDMMIAACDQLRYEQLGYQGNHASCADNLCVAMRRLGYNIDVIPQPINLFAKTVVGEDGSFFSPDNPVAAGAFIELEALIDLICAVSCCPFDLDLEGWAVNAPGTPPSELVIELL